MKYDVIGAGAAGLAAARTLSGAGKRVCILEACGRVHSLHLPDLPLPIELGAESIHGESATTFSIVEAAALAAAELPDDHWWSRDGRREKVEDFWGQIDRIRAKIKPRQPDVPFAEFRNTLFFAGEATSTDETGTVAGAIESGRRAAKEALRS